MKKIYFLLIKSKLEVPVSKILLFEHNPMSDLELLSFDRCFNISLYFKFLNSGFCLFNLTNLKSKFNFGLIRFLSEIDKSIFINCYS